MANFNQFLKQAQSMQKKMQEMQDQMASAEYTGNAGGGLVQIVISGRGEARKALIDPSLLREIEKEMLEDLIIAAFNDAKSKADQDSQNSMADAFSNISLPPGLKMPF
ncbi:YbaB/EbfC family nucleoid-associated protein [Candidatus Tisiphia endosymbiont of Nemotelus uliginosus]|uniref:YbaB/EbfC family nucleoid-associated protein n=1 Tax=Candidatus Tisiphia endosymbiont of Nemotelus uliginosus TaxID=3077926 RepID=UPI0035C8A8F0